MKILRIDHLHMKGNNFDKTAQAMEKLIGQDFYMRMDFTEKDGAEVAYQPYPIGLELFNPTDISKNSGRIAAESQPGVIAISYKVPNIKEAQGEMESLGYKLIEYFDYGEIQEALYDTKDDFGLMIELIEYPGDSITDVSNNIEDL
ncbi:hypothetical protein GH810_07310 [Acetobacterium paludosum]|uniref:VOC domain-containing protein n=1 Tax=Acetobacterium paludosum TaxID=52693 RepID=A0A923HWW0_9FIRM|nr:hypothetical protein [Acetobacterium paludosum]MBC3888114.1 hypothetical protein [Acetobacterium paludosum]